jgi:hypothetical protein
MLPAKQRLEVGARRCCSRWRPSRAGWFGFIGAQASPSHSGPSFLGTFALLPPATAAMGKADAAGHGMRGQLRAQGTPIAMLYAANTFEP